MSESEVNASRRDLFRWIGAASVAGSGVLGALAPAGVARAATSQASTSKTSTAKTSTAKSSTAKGSTANASASTFAPLRPPAVPLAVRSPYLSTWHAADTLTGTWSTFWNGHVNAFCGIARIDGAGWLFCGAPGSSVVPNTMTQTALQLTGTRSIYTFTGGGITLTVTFFSPVDLTNLQRQCVPFSYVTLQAVANDGSAHTVQLHLDISAEWTHGDVNQQVTWSQQTTRAGNVALSFQPAGPTVLGEYGDQASWGTSVLATSGGAGVTWQIGADSAVRGQAVSQGSLTGTSDPNQPRAIDDNWPVLGLTKDLGSVSSSPSALFHLAVGHVRTPAVSYLGNSLAPWWTTYWGPWADMVDWFLADHDPALAAATALEAQIQNDATAAVGGGSVGNDYAALCALALRQAVGGTELVNRGGAPWAFLKEISSDGNVSTIDVTYPAFPAYLYLSPSYFQLLLEPILQYCESGGWPKTFAVHDLGSSYPNAAGHNDGSEEDMPVEESANMLIMTAALLQHLPAAGATAFAQQHYAILKQWADYLLANALDPANQNQTDDFTGFIAHSVNLALKGIIGIGAMGVVAGFAGNASDKASYTSTARSYISQWVSKGEDPAYTNLDLAYGSSSTWSLKYNGFSDQVLGLDLVPLGIAAQEAGWYQQKAGTYGVLLDPRNNYTKADWELWTAAWLRDQGAIRNTLISGVYGFANTTPQRVPFSDWYVVASAAQQGFQNRPVVGGMFTLITPRAPSSTSWQRIQNSNSGKVLAVSGMSLADSANVTQWSDNGTADHVWTVIHNPDGTVRIQNRNSGRVLAVNNQSLADGAFVQQYQDNGTPDHLWTLIDAGGGWFKIQNYHSGKVMAVSGMSLADGAQVTQWSDNGSADHLWRFI